MSKQLLHVQIAISENALRTPGTSFAADSCAFESVRMAVPSTGRQRPRRAWAVMPQCMQEWRADA